MKKANLSISFSVDWVERATDCRKCSTCDDIIASNMFQLYLTRISPTGVGMYYKNITVCAECHQVIIDVGL